MRRQPPSLVRQSYVYVIGGSDQRLVKIGVSTNPKGRCASIQTGCPFPVSILWLAEGNGRREDALHEYFTDRRVQGEWFKFPEGHAVALVSAAYGEMYPQPMNLRLPTWTAPLELIDPPSPPLTRPENAWEAVRQHLRDQGSRIVGID